MNFAVLRQPHWNVARQALSHAGASDASEILAWKRFREAAKAEGWLLESGSES
jgi:hypothetical protein